MKKRYFYIIQLHNLIKMKLNILMLLSLIILTSSVLAQEISDVEIIKIKQGEAYNLNFPCSQEGSLCPASTICTATAFRPITQEPFFTNITATNNGTYYNITIPGIHPLGVYRNDINCNNGTNSGFDTIWIKITPTGDLRGFSLPLILGLTAFILLATALFYRNPYFGIIAGFLFGINGVYLVIYGLNDIADLYTRTLGWVSIGLGIIFIIVGAYETALEGKEDDDA